MTTTPKTGSQSGQPVSKPRLEGQMGPLQLALVVLAYSAPIAVASGFLSLTIIYNGAGSTFAFLVGTAILLIFTIGYMALVKNLPKPGGFYSLISTGLGKIVGLGSAFLASTSYLVNLAGAYAFTGVTTAAMVASFGGPDSPWWIWVGLMWIVVSVFGYLKVDFSARVVVFIMMLEVAVVIVFNVAVFIQGGAEGLQAEPWTPSAFFAGDIPVTLLFCFLVFFGFEATALFRDEVKEPSRTIPRATFGAVIFIGVLYTITQYALYSAFGSDAVDVATESPATMFSMAIGTYVAPVFTQIVLVMVVTSELASLIAIHNITTRYVHNLACNGALPAYLSGVHPRHKSPHRASITISIIAIALLVPFILGGASGEVLYALLIGLAAIGILTLMALVSLSALVWFLRNRDRHAENFGRSVLVPAISTLTLGATAVFGSLNFHLVGAGTPGQYTPLQLVLILSFAVGVVVAFVYKYKRPDLYRHLGRDDRLEEMERS